MINAAVLGRSRRERADRRKRLTNSTNSLSLKIEKQATAASLLLNLKWVRWLFGLIWIQFMYDLCFSTQQTESCSPFRSENSIHVSILRREENLIWLHDSHSCNHSKATKGNGRVLVISRQSRSEHYRPEATGRGQLELTVVCDR